MTPDLPRAVAREIVERLQQAGFAAFWVGGCVRDFLLGREPQDFDIATDAKPEQVEKLFKRTVAVGRKFGVMVVVENKQQFQVATFRAEERNSDTSYKHTTISHLYGNTNLIGGPWQLSRCPIHSDSDS